MRDNFKSLVLCAAILFAFVSCEKPDSEKAWGIPLIYMPQANYNPYVVPNGGSAAQTNLNYSIDDDNDVLNIFLGVYRSGLQEKLSYKVNVNVENTALKGTTLLPAAYYDIPMEVVCPDGERDATFYLSVDLNYLKANRNKDFSVVVYISDPSRYALNEDLCSTTVRIDTANLLSKEGL